MWDPSRPVASGSYVGLGPRRRLLAELGDQRAQAGLRVGIVPGVDEMVEADVLRPQRLDHVGACDRARGQDRLARQLQQRLQPRQRAGGHPVRSEEHTSELQSLMRLSYAVFCLKKTTKQNKQ